MRKNHLPGIWSGQLLHFAALAVLLIITWIIWTKIGRPFPFLFWLTICIPIAHQIFVWLAWRVELKSKAISNSIGLKTYLSIFFVLLVGRLIFFLFLAWVDRESIGLGMAARIIISTAFLLPALYTMYCVRKYFGFVRAAGADHFDSKYQSMSLVKKGMFKYSSNSMYIFGFMMFWGLALACNSEAALLAAAFSHAYIWVHYFATEKLDMKYLYG